MEYLIELLAILNEMSPYLILGFLISGLLHVYVPKTLYSRFLHRKGIGSVMGAALLGVPLPLCSCGVIPTAMSLKKEGASDGATVAFLVGTPQTGVDSILATYSLLGLPFA
ncbi:MAG: permease, partial [Rikenellaceae bacterium]